MFTVTITHDDGRVTTYEEVVGIDFIDKEFCETVAGHELSDEELKWVEDAIDGCSDFPDETDLKQIIDEYEGDEEDDDDEEEEEEEDD